MKGKQPVTVELDTVQCKFLEEIVNKYSLPDTGKALRCLINYVRSETDKQDEVFAEIRCVDC